MYKQFKKSIKWCNHVRKLSVTVEVNTSLPYDLIILHKMKNENEIQKMKNEKIYIQKNENIYLWKDSYKHIHRGFCFITGPTWEQPYHCSSSSCSNDSFPYLSDYSPMNMFCLIQLKWILNQLKDFQSSLTSKNTVGLIFALY